MLILIIPFGLFLHLFLKGINHETPAHEPGPLPAELHETRQPDASEEHNPGANARRDSSLMPCPASNRSTFPERDSSISE